MEWVLFVSLQWVVSGSPTPPNTVLIEQFASEELCKKAADAIKTEIGDSVSRTATRSDDGTRDMSATEGKVAATNARGLKFIWPHYARMPSKAAERAISLASD